MTLTDKQISERIANRNRVSAAVKSRSGKAVLHIQTAQLHAIRLVKFAVQFGVLPSLRGSDIQCSHNQCKRRATQWEHRDYANPLAVNPVCTGCNQLCRSGDNGNLRVRKVKAVQISIPSEIVAIFGGKCMAARRVMRRMVMDILLRKIKDDPNIVSNAHY